MNPQLPALFTAIAWGVGGFLEKKGLHLGRLWPQMGITTGGILALTIGQRSQRPDSPQSARRPQRFILRSLCSPRS